MAKMSREEKFKLILAARAADKRGDHEEAQRLRRMRPLAPHLAMSAKEILGADHVRKAGFNLSEAEAVYGKDWLDR